MPQSKRYFDYFRTIKSDRWHKVKDFAPSNPDLFIANLEMLPFSGRYISKDRLSFMIVGKL